MRKLAILLAFLLTFSMAFATDYDFNVRVDLPGDTNYLYPSGSTTTIQWDVNHIGDPGDVDFNLFYSTATITTAGWIHIADVNAAAVCDDVNFAGATPSTCTYTWTLPTGLDANYYVDVNAIDLTVSGGHDNNVSSGSFYIDTNACDSEHSISGSDQVTITTTCSGYGADGNYGAATTKYSKSRQGKCGDGYSTYGIPFNLTFGEFTVCYYSIDSLGNTETTLGFTHTADSDALSVALLTELALAGLLLFAILGAVVLWKQELDAKLIIALVTGAVIVVICIVIFATVL